LNAARHPQKIAIRCDEDRVTYGEADDISDRIAAGLRRIGMHAGDRVAVMIPTSVVGVLVPVGVIKAALVYVGINILYGPAEVASILADCGARAMIVHESLVRVVDEARNRAPNLEQVVVIGTARGHIEFDELVERPVEATQARSVNPALPAVVCYSS